MRTFILRIGTIALLTAAIAALPTQLLAQTTNQHAADKKAAAAKPDEAVAQKNPHAFRGKLAAVDKAARTIKLGKSTYVVTAATKITKNGKPATLEDGVIGEPVSGYVKPAPNGTMTATTLTFGPKTPKP